LDFLASYYIFIVIALGSVNGISDLKSETAEFWIRVNYFRGMLRL